MPDHLDLDRIQKDADWIADNDPHGEMSSLVPTVRALVHEVERLRAALILAEGPYGPLAERLVPYFHDFYDRNDLSRMQALRDRVYDLAHSEPLEVEDD